MKKLLITTLIILGLLTGLSFIKFFSTTITTAGLNCFDGSCSPSEKTETVKVNYWQYVKE